jgi:hypothetical protein
MVSVARLALRPRKTVKATPHQFRFAERVLACEKAHVADEELQPCFRRRVRKMPLRAQHGTHAAKERSAVIYRAFLMPECFGVVRTRLNITAVLADMTP